MAKRRNLQSSRSLLQDCIELIELYNDFNRVYTENEEGSVRAHIIQGNLLGLLNLERSRLQFEEQIKKYDHLENLSENMIRDHYSHLLSYIFEENVMTDAKLSKETQEALSRFKEYHFHQTILIQAAEIDYLKKQVREMSNKLNEEKEYPGISKKSKQIHKSDKGFSSD